MRVIATKNGDKGLKYNGGRVGREVENVGAMQASNVIIVNK